MLAFFIVMSSSKNASSTEIDFSSALVSSSNYCKRKSLTQSMGASITFLLFLFGSLFVSVLLMNSNSGESRDGKCSSTQIGEKQTPARTMEGCETKEMCS